MKPPFELRRRSFLTSMGASALLLPFARTGQAEPDANERRYVGLYFSGGWDVLLGPDPRDPSKSYSGIDLGTSLLSPEYRDPFPVMMGGQMVLWGPTMKSLERHADVLTLFRGVNMNTLAHPAGRAYVNTFIPPSGAVARGDSLGTRMASGDYTDVLLPNVSLGLPSFNRSFPADLNGISLDRATDLRSLVQELEEVPFSDETLEALEAAQDQIEGCVHERYGERPVDDLQIARARMRELLSGNAIAAFDLDSDADLLARYGITNANADFEPGVVAATVWRLLETGLTRSVTAQLQRRLDTHLDNWATDHPLLLQAGFDALAALLDDLREEDPQLSKTTVLVFSEFARTPKINGVGGRDHWFASSVLVFGGGLHPGVCGATVEATMGLLTIDTTTGQPDPAGDLLFPEHIGATLAKAAGLDTEPFRVDPLDAWIA